MSVYIDSFDQDPTKDNTRERHVDVGQDNPVTIYAEDPYGFWQIRWYVGVTPKELQGNFTSFLKAEDALRNWLDNNRSRMEVKKIASTVEEKIENAEERKERKPVLQTKQRYKKNA